MKKAVCCSIDYLNNLRDEELVRIRNDVRPTENRPWLFILGEDINLGSLSEVIKIEEYRCYTSLQRYVQDKAIYECLTKALIRNYGFDGFLYFFNESDMKLFGNCVSQRDLLNPTSSIVEVNTDQKLELNDFIEYIRDLLPNSYDRKALARTVAEIFSNEENYLYIDISTLVHFDHATGIQRVVKELSNQLLSQTILKCRFVYSYPGHDHFYNVDVSEMGFKAVSVDALSSEMVDFNDGDKLLFLDLHPSNAYTKNNLIQNLKLRGIKCYFVVYDLLPISHPHCFVQELVDDFEKWLHTVAHSNGAFCISKDVSNKLSNWISLNVDCPDRNFINEHFHLGANFSNDGSNNSNLGKSQKLAFTVDSPETKYLMVGTVEPRKGHLFVLDVFEQLWSEGHSCTLIIVGKIGWKSEGISSRIINSQFINSRLFWLEKVDDEELVALYGISDVLIAASEGEGFGLPLIEAAQYNKVIFSRDIPVFREVAKEYALYFESKEDLKELILNYSFGKYKTSEGMPYLSWKQSCDRLVDLLEDKHVNE
ncbi:TPA: glycosyltransferase family 4 protein [Vibrio cholerae]